MGGKPPSEAAANGHVRRALQDLWGAVEHLRAARELLGADASKFGETIGWIKSAIGQVTDEW